MKRKKTITGFSKYAIEGFTVVAVESGEQLKMNQENETYRMVHDNGEICYVTHDEIVKMRKYAKYKYLNEQQRSILRSDLMRAHEKAYRLWMSGLTTKQISMDMDRLYDNVARDVWRYKSKRMSLERA